MSPVIRVAGVDPNLAAGDRGESAVAVILHLEQPVASARDLVDEGGELGRPELRERDRAFAGPHIGARDGSAGHRRLAAWLVALSDTAQVTAGLDAGGEFLGEAVLARRIFVVVLDEEPVLARRPVALFGVAALHVDKDPLALHALALEGEFQVALVEALMRVADRFPSPLIPQHDGA